MNQYPSSELAPTPHTSQGYDFDADGNLTRMFIAGDMDCSGTVNNTDNTILNLGTATYYSHIQESVG